MAAGAAIVGTGIGIGQARKARKASQAATELAAEQQQQTTEEEIRRQEYTHRRDISSIEAEIAAGGISSTGEGLRVEGRITTPYDAEIATLEGRDANIDTELQNWEFSWDSGISRLGEVAGRKKETTERLEELKFMQKRELEAPWNPEGGIFAEYLIERERVQTAEIGWMERTGLSSVASITAEGARAASAARSLEIKSYANLASQAANWWESSQTPTNTTTTQQVTS